MKKIVLIIAIVLIASTSKAQKLITTGAYDSISFAKDNYTDSLKKYNAIYSYYSRFGCKLETLQYYADKWTFYATKVDSIKDAADKQIIKKQLETQYKIKL